jgi:hypothetical protein
MTWALQLAAVLAVPLGLFGAAWAGLHLYSQARSPRPREAGSASDGIVEGVDMHSASDTSDCGGSDGGGGDCGGGD